MSAPKKQKINHHDEKEDVDGAKQLALLGERSVRDLLAKKERELLQTQQALSAAMEVVNDTSQGQYEWGDLSLAIRKHPTCVIQAIRDEKVRLKSSHIPQELLQNNREVAREACKAGLYDKFRPTKEEWFNDKALSRVALAQGSIKNMVDDAPMLTADDVVDLLENRKLGWEQIPEELKADEIFCRRIVAFQTGVLAHRVFELLPHLVQDRQVWANILSSPSRYSSKRKLLNLMRSHPPPNEFWADVTFVQQAYEKDPRTLEFADPIALAELIQRKIRETPQNLAFCPRDFPGQSAEFVEGQLVEFSNSLEESHDFLAAILSGKIPGHLLEAEGFAASWFQAAGLPMTSHHSLPFRANREILLLIAQHGRYLNWKRKSLKMAPAELLDDVSFITEVMNHEPTLLEVASERIRENNFELAMAALSQPVFVTRCREANEAYAQARTEADAQARAQGRMFWTGSPIILSVETLKTFYGRAENGLMLYDNFVNHFLAGLRFVGHDTPLHHMMLKLNQVQEIKMLIGEFVGYPRSREVRNNMENALAVFRALVIEAENGDGDVEAGD